MIKKLLKNKYFLILSIIVIVLIIIKIISSQQTAKDFSSSNPPVNQNSSLSNTSPTGTTTDSTNTSPNPTKTIKITEVNYQIPLYNLLPYQGKYFQVKRYLKANNLELIVYRKENTELAKQEAQEWLTKNGVGTIDTFTVVYP